VDLSVVASSKTPEFFIAFFGQMSTQWQQKIHLSSLICGRFFPFTSTISKA
jgi:hypothetical protein